MIEQLKTIRAGLETATCYSMLGVDAHAVQTALTALTHLEAMAGEQEPKFWYRPVGNDGLYEGPVHHNSIGGKMLRDEKPGEWVPLFEGAAPVAQQPQAEQRQSDIFCGVDFADGVLSVSVLRRRPDDVAELLHSEQIELPVSAAPQQSQAEAVLGMYEHKCPSVTGHRGPSFVCQKAGHAVGQNSYCNECPAAPQQAEAVPPGYVLVPVEPTEEMLAPSYMGKTGPTWPVRKEIYRAMVAAAIAQQKGASHE